MNLLRPVPIYPSPSTHLPWVFTEKNSVDPFAYVILGRAYEEKETQTCDGKN
jgi:hypothetical protein